ncbi:MAG: DUF362 domain-containing protein [Rikenellaceae bacterium]|nr:DUF362 domain-containing protein [Rikenellaceae bacterium]
MKRIYFLLKEKYHKSLNKKLTAKVLFILMSIAAVSWFLILVIPKPSRAAYPCMQAAAPLMSSLVIWLLSVTGTYLAFKKIGRFLQRKKYMAAVSLLVIGFAGLFFLQIRNSGYGISQTPQKQARMHNPPNTPIGEGKGIFPGRVAWSHAPGAAHWDGENGFWFDDKWNSQEKTDRLVTSSLLSLTGAVTEKEAWNKLFIHFNTEHGKGNTGYRSGEKIAIKINQNNTSSHDDSEEYNTSPHVLLSLLRSLVNEAGVPQQYITVCEPSRFITDYMFAKCYAEFPQVIYVDFEGGNGRTKSEYVDNAIPYSIDNGKLAQGIATCIMEADYLINSALLKIHSGPGVTLTAKNWYGVTNIDKVWRNNSHAGFNHDRSGKTAYRTFVDFMGHKELGQKTLLYIIDGLYGSRDVNGIPAPKWNMEPFNGDWANSLFMSQNAVAIDAVGLDFLASEWPEVSSLNYCDAYLVEAASIPNPPSGTVYDPERDNVPLNSPLGVMEHWNNPIDKQYSRNLGKTEGIELIYRSID